MAYTNIITNVLVIAVIAEKFCLLLFSHAGVKSEAMLLAASRCAI